MIAYNRYYEANIPIDYWNFNMNEFKGPEILKKVYNNSIENIQNIYSDGKSFSLLGDHGIGKTTIGASILKKAAEKNYNCLYTTLSEMVSAITESPYEDRYLAKKELYNVDLLLVDELDGRFIGSSTNSIDFFGKSLEAIIRGRFSNKLPNIFISNSPNLLESFTGSFKESIGSLMSGVKEFVSRGEDFRKMGTK